ncbi:hypothetical protein [Tautonia plasticadhaerens]|uniref:DUF1559 domain-containing protein n=1 Tax=Tautonia plasticadhaerens TaxID=2527974 RepID=A0A518GXU9_9BACT|nr:hypothetical protein [Tautonia plasticadhaerens]QDV33393.1 hypothetical protein ElP_12640 [Tautonia plasticadhaerens]
MNDSALFDEAFGQLGPEQIELLDRASAADPALASRRDRLHRALDLLLDSDEPEPPPGLADRTFDRIARHAEEPRILEFAPNRPRYRWADVGVAAAVMLIGLMSLVPAVRDQSRQAGQLTCVDNLRQVGLALNQYASTFETYPHVDPSCPASYVGAAFVQLGEAGLLRDRAILDCPCDGLEEARDRMLGWDELMGRERRWPGTCRDDIRVDYAYHHGTRQGEGRAIPGGLGTPGHMPLVADQPPFRLDQSADDGRLGGVILSGNSPNHSGAGQNVLFTDGRVSWRRSRWISKLDTDLFLNEHKRIGPGVHKVDAVLTPCVFRFRD